MPQESNVAPRWFIKVINEVTKDLANVVSCIDDVDAFDPDLAAHVVKINERFKPLRKHTLKKSPSEAKIVATDAGFLGHTISPAGIRPNASKLAAVMSMPMPQDFKQPRYLVGSLPC